MARPDIASMSRAQRLNFRRKKFGEFLNSDEQLSSYWSGLDNNGKEDLMLKFYDQLTKKEPELGRYKTGEKEVRYQSNKSSGSYAPIVTSTRKVNVYGELYDDRTEYLYDSVRKGLVSPQELYEASPDSFIAIGGILNQRGNATANGFKDVAQEIYKPMSGLKDPSDPIFNITTGLTQPVVDLAVFAAEKMDGDTSAYHRMKALEMVAYPENQKWQGFGQVLGVMGGSVGVYKELAKRGLATVVKREGGKRVINKGALAATAAAEFGLGYAYNMPTLTEAITGKESNRVISGLEAMFMGSALNLAVDAVMPMRGMTGKQAADYLNQKNPDLLKNLKSKVEPEPKPAMAEGDEIAKELQEALESNQLGSPASTPISEGAGPASTPEMVRIREIDNEVSQLQNREQVIKSRRGLSKKERRQLNEQRSNLINERVRLQYSPALTKNEQMAEEAMPGSVLGIVPYSMPTNPEAQARLMKELLARTVSGGAAAGLVDPDEMPGGRAGSFVAGFIAADPRVLKYTKKATAKGLSMLPENTRDMVTDFGASAKGVAGSIVEPLDQQLLQISPKIFNSLRRFELQSMVSLKENMDIAQPFFQRLNEFKKLGTLSDSDITDLTAGIYNRDVNRRTTALNKIDSSGVLAGQFDQIDAMLQRLHRQALDAGIDIKFLQDYYPRMIKNLKGLRRNRGITDTSVYDKAIREFRSKYNRGPNGLERADIANKLITQGRRDGGPSYLQERKLDTLEDSDIPYYYNLQESLGSYIYDITNRIALKKFTGAAYKAGKTYTKQDPLGNKYTTKQYPKNQGSVIEDSIGDEIEEMVAGLNASKQIDDADVNKTIQLLRSRLVQGPSGPNSFVNGYRNIHYITTIGNPFSAATQLSDVAMAATKSASASKTALGRALKNKKFDINPEDYGLIGVAEDMMNPGMTGKWLEFTLKYSGFKAMDKLGKASHLSSAYHRLKNAASAPRNSAAFKKFQKEQQPRFGDEFDDLVDALKAGDRTNENVRLSVFNELADVQPITLSSMPEMYVKSKNGRIAYALKSFTIKQLDFIRRQMIEKIAKAKNPSEVREGLANLARYSVVFGGTTAGMNTAKDMFLGREVNMSDQAVDAAMQTMGLTRYSLYRGRDFLKGDTGEKVKGLFADLVLPVRFVFDPVDDAFKASQGKVQGFEDITSVRNVPLGIGKTAYWRFGEGKKKEESRKTGSINMDNMVDFDFNMDILK
ncbi:hypothetical protein [Limnobacter sp.]|uniref:hypothetical protein n=1 Tax=Limnobacter sp. TaxID=2003368 RepID=UPI0025BDCB9D|nr:hypothetical protein [Limnobacter sp.]